MKTFRRGGIHPAANKLTSNSPIRQITVPDEVTILLSQSIGKPSRPLVKAGETVSRGDKIAEADGIISANLHSPVSGTVKKIDKVRTSSGEWAKAIIITRMENEREEKENPRSQREVENLTPDEIKDIIGEAGIVGLGGATFPTKVKLSPPPGCTLKYLIINGAECEPYLTCDDRLMQEYAVEVVKGSRLLMRASGVVKTIIGIEENKPEAIEAMTAATAHEPDISVEILKKKYPQGGEKEMTEALLGIEIPEGKLPASVGVIVDSVATAYAVYDAVWNRRPLYQRIITVTGPSLTNPGNFLVPDGTNIKSLIDLAGGLPEDTGKVVIGGPMMGKGSKFH